MACDQRDFSRGALAQPLKLDSTTWRIQIFFQASVIVSPEGDTIPQHCCATAVVVVQVTQGRPGESDPLGLQVLLGFGYPQLLGSVTCAAPKLSTGVPGTCVWLQPSTDLDQRCLPRVPCVPEMTWRGDATRGSSSLFRCKVTYVRAMAPCQLHVHPGAGGR